MTDTAATPAITAPAAVAASAVRVRRRYAAERRFRFYGVAALVIAASFVAVLLTDVVTKAIPAFTETRVMLDVPVTAEVVDPKGTLDPKVIVTADFNALVRGALHSKFPTVSSRTDRKALNGILSSGAADALQRQIVADSTLIGKTVPVSALLSADADLFAKGRMTPVIAVSGRGTANPSATEGEVTVLSTSNDFAEALLAVKRSLASRADEINFEASRLESNARRSAGEEKASLEAKAAALRAEAADLMKRYGAAGSPEVVDAEEPSTLVLINGGVVKASEVANDRIKGVTLIPLTNTNAAAPGQWRVETLVVPEANRRVGDHAARAHYFRCAVAASRPGTAQGRRHRSRGHGGLEPGARPASRRWAALQRCRVHQSQPRPS